MRQGDRFGKILVQAQRTGNAARELGDLNAVGEASTKEVAFMIDEDLRLVLETTKGGGMDDTVAVALELAAPRGRRLGPLTAA